MKIKCAFTHARLFLIGSTLAQIATGADESSYPAFEDYLSEEELRGAESVEVDLSSHPSANLYRTRLREGFSKGANFANHYAITAWGCGNECEQLLIADINTGLVFGIAGNAMPVEASRGLDFRLESRLLVIDPPCSMKDNPCVSYGRMEMPVRFYLMEAEGLRLMREIPCHFQNEIQECL